MEQEEINKLKNIDGQVRGVTLQTDAVFVTRKIGQDGVAKLQQKTKELGWEIDYKNVQITGWYPVGLRAFSLLCMKEAFGWGDKEMQEAGNDAPKYSFIAAMMMKYFISIRKVFNETPKYWEKHWRMGKLEPHELDELQKRMVLRIVNFKIHPVLCPYFLGYFKRIG